MSKRDSKLYLEDIYLSIKKMDKYVKNMSFDEFEKDGKTIDAIVRNLEILGEAAKHLSPDFKNRKSQIPWSKMVAIRNKVIHEYFGVDIEILWKTIKEDLVDLKKAIKKLL